MFSAGITRGLIEACGTDAGAQRQHRFSAGITRGLIEAISIRTEHNGRAPFSAGITRGLIEACKTRRTDQVGTVVFRGDYPRPH